MKILFQDVALIDKDIDSRFYVATDGAYITYVGDRKPADNDFDRVIDGRGRLLTPAFYNAHTHAAMTLFRGYGEDLPLDKWLNERIFPAEDRLNEERVYYGVLLAIAEMIRNGIVSFSDMYFFCDAAVRAVAESGIKANISRSVVSFDKVADFTADTRMKEGIDLFQRYHNACDGRIRIDMSLHAEYTNVAEGVRYLADVAHDLGARVQIHLSETEKEHKECIARHGTTPTEFFFENGLFRSPVTAAHCVYLTDSDRKIMAENGATAVHNPVSNLKLGSGIMPLRHTLDAGINVALGTDGAASNNRLDLLREMQLAALLEKGCSRRPDNITAKDVFGLATVNGARAQGRDDCGEIAVGRRADILLWDTAALHNLPVYDYYTMLSGSAGASDVTLTMADGHILYEDGVYTTLDVEKLRAEFLSVQRHYFD